MITEEHRAFKLSRPSYLRGKRVNRRLYWMTILVKSFAVLCGIGVSLACIFLPWETILNRSTDSQNHDPVLGVTLLLGIVTLIAVMPLTLRIVKSFHLATETELRDFPWGPYWPETWLEPKEQG